MDQGTQWTHSSTILRIIIAFIPCILITCCWRDEQPHVSCSSFPLLPCLFAKSPHLVLVLGPAEEASRQGGVWRGGVQLRGAGSAGAGGSREGSVCHLLYLALLLPGMFCSSEGLSQPSGLCHSAHYCTGGAMSPTPIKHKVGKTRPLAAQRGGYSLAHPSVYGLRTTGLVRGPCFLPGLQLREGRTLLTF